jgi:hypothetical protein
MMNAVARPKKNKLMTNGGGIPLTASGSAVAPAVSPMKKPRKPTVKKDDAAGSATGAVGTPVATPEKPEKPERGKGRPRKIRPLEPGTAAAATAAAAAAASAAAVAASSVHSLATPNNGVGGGGGGGTPNAAASSSSASQPKNRVERDGAQAAGEGGERAVSVEAQLGQADSHGPAHRRRLSVGDPDSAVPARLCRLLAVPRRQGCNERHASDRQLATHIRMAHDDGKWRCPLLPGRV